MRICLVRHAIAGERDAAKYPDDGLRPLTPEGRTRMAEAARGLRTLFVPQAILTSPLLRAEQTADILLKAYGLHKARRCEALVTGDDEQLLKDISDVDAENVLLVGHEPHMSGSLAFLLTGEQAGMAATFKKGAAALVACEGEPGPGTCTLEWLLQPAALRGLGGKA